MCHQTPHSKEATMGWFADVTVNTSRNDAPGGKGWIVQMDGWRSVCVISRSGSRSELQE